MRYEIRELNVGGILDQAIKVTKDNFWLFLKIALVLLIPYTLLTGMLVHWFTPEVPTIRQPGMFAPGAQAGFGMPTALIGVIGITTLINLIIVAPITDATMIYSITNAYLGKPNSVGIAFSRAFRIFLPLLGTWILMWLAIAAPMMVGVISAALLGPVGYLVILIMVVFSIVFMFWFMLASRIVVVEGIAGTAALSRSRRLMKGNSGTVFTVLFVVGLIGGLVGGAIGFVPQPELQVVLRAIVQAILAIFTAAALVVFYFSCRCKVENFDLTMLADAVAADDAPVQNYETT